MKAATLTTFRVVVRGDQAGKRVRRVRHVKAKDMTSAVMQLDKDTKFLAGLRNVSNLQVLPPL